MNSECGMRTLHELMDWFGWDEYQMLWVAFLITFRFINMVDFLRTTLLLLLAMHLCCFK